MLAVSVEWCEPGLSFSPHDDVSYIFWHEASGVDRPLCQAEPVAETVCKDQSSGREGGARRGIKASGANCFAKQGKLQDYAEEARPRCRHLRMPISKCRDDDSSPSAVLRQLQSPV